MLNNVKDQHYGFGMHCAYNLLCNTLQVHGHIVDQKVIVQVQNRFPALTLFLVTIGVQFKQSLR